MNTQEETKTNSRNVGKIVSEALHSIDPHSPSGVRVIATLCYRDSRLWDSLQSFPSSMRLTNSPYYMPDIETWIEKVSIAIVRKVILETKPGYDGYNYVSEDYEPLPAMTYNNHITDNLYKRADSKAFQSIGKALIVNEDYPTFRVSIAGIGKLVIDNSLKAQGKHKSHKRLANREIQIINTVSHVRILAQYGEYLHCIARAKIARKLYAKVSVNVGHGQTAKLSPRPIVGIYHKVTGDFVNLGVIFDQWVKDKHTGERSKTGRQLLIGLDSNVIGELSEYNVKRVTTGNEASKACVEFILHMSQLTSIQASMQEKDWRNRKVITTAHVVSRYMPLVGISLLHSADKLQIPSLAYVPYDSTIQPEQKPVNPTVLARLDILRTKLGIAS